MLTKHSRTSNNIDTGEITPTHGGEEFVNCNDTLPYALEVKKKDVRR